MGIEQSLLISPDTKLLNLADSTEQSIPKHQGHPPHQDDAPQPGAGSKDKRKGGVSLPPPSPCALLISSWSSGWCSADQELETCGGTPLFSRQEQSRQSSLLERGPMNLDWLAPARCGSDRQHLWNLSPWQLKTANSRLSKMREKSQMRTPKGKGSA